MKRRTFRTILAAVATALAFSAPAYAAGGNYVFDGGTSKQRKHVRMALNASAFDWGMVPGPITIHIDPENESVAAPGEIWLDADLLDAGVFSWGVVQHEYAHQVDFFLLDDVDRVDMLPLLGGVSWWEPESGGAAHHELACERFASTLAWSYWPSPRNSMKPRGSNDESAALTPREFRALLADVIGAADRLAASQP